MMLATRMIHMQQIFLYNTFQRMLLYNQNGRVSIVFMEEILLFKVVGLMLHLVFEDGCYEHIPLVKFRELRLPMNSAIKNADWEAYSQIGHDYSTIFSADISQATNGELLNVVYFTSLRCTHTLCLSTWLHLRFSDRLKIPLVVVSIAF